MLKVSNVEVWGFEHALRGMRNPMNSWAKSDTDYYVNYDTWKREYEIGPNDLSLARRLINAGPEHRKFTRQIFISMDIEAPLYWWKEFDTYKIGTTANSTSTMHKIHDKEFELSDFSIEHLEMDSELYNERLIELDSVAMPLMTNIIETLNYYRRRYLEAKAKPMKEEAKRAKVMKYYWWKMIQLLPSTYNQKRTVTMTYENAYNMEHQRENHKLDEWHVFVDEINKLPHYRELFKGE